MKTLEEFQKMNEGRGAMTVGELAKVLAKAKNQDAIISVQTQNKKSSVSLAFPEGDGIRLEIRRV